MDGKGILIIGIGMIALAILLFIASIVYQKTAGKRIREELKKEYD